MYIVASNRAGCQDDTLFTLGHGEAQKVHGSSLFQVCCIYLPIVIIQHTSTLSNCGNHTRVFQFYGLYWWILSIYVFEHSFGCNTTYYAYMWMRVGSKDVLDCVGFMGLFLRRLAWWVWLVGLFEMRWLYSHALVGGKAGLPLNWGDNASHTMSHVFPTTSQSHAYFVNGPTPPTHTHTSTQILRRKTRIHWSGR